ncbi:MAG: DUF1284 domain-containing protein [Bdellovibrionales bacterium]|nr:DUF1284 domain-containing protein [Bdellovibrionales bacterium]
MPIRFRPHHFLCALGFRGKGYSPEFVAGFQAVVDRLRGPGGDAERIEVTGATDTICEPCPHRRGTLCETEGKIRALDGAHARVLGLRGGDRLTWGEAKRRIAENFTVEAHRRACAACSWQVMGLCEEALVDLRRELGAEKPAPRRPWDRSSLLLGGLLSALLSLAGGAAAFAAVPEAGEEPVVAPATSPKAEDAGLVDGPRTPTPTTSGGIPTSSMPPTPRKVLEPAVAPSADDLAPEELEIPALITSGGSVKAEGPIVDGSKFIDDILRQLRSGKRSTTAAKIRDAYVNMGKERYSQVLLLATQIRRDPMFEDYGVFLAARAYLRRASFKLSKKKHADAAADALDAGRRFAEIPAQFPDSPFAEESPLDLSEAELVGAAAAAGRARWKEAQAQYEKAFTRLIPAGRLMRSGREHIETYAKACSKAKTRQCFAWAWRLADNLPKASQEAQAIAKYIPEAVAMKDKAELADRLTTTYYGELKDEESFNAAFELYMRRDYGDAVEAFQQFLEEFPKSVYRHRARHWLARAYDRKGDRTRGRTMHEVLLSEAPLTFYGILSALALGKSPVSYVDATLPTVQTEDAFLYPLEIRRLERAEKLIAVGALTAASAELSGLQARRVHGNKFLMYLALLNHQSRNYLESFRILGELFNRGYEGVNSSHSIRLIFPIMHDHLIQRFAEANRIDPILVLSLMKQESAFDSGAVSRAGAMGLMQLMPLTAVDTEPDVELAALTDPLDNVRVGTSYIARILRQFNGNIVHTLAGYNAGPGRVRRWKREFADRFKREPEMLEFIELIPYKETREYVGAIIRNYYWYSYRLNGTLLTSLDYFWGVSGPLSHPLRLSN